MCGMCVIGPKTTRIALVRWALCGDLGRMTVSRGSAWCGARSVMSNSDQLDELERHGWRCLKPTDGI